MIVRLGLSILATFSAAHAADVVSCRMPNGEVRIVAVPPEGCVVTEPYKLRKAPRGGGPAIVREVAPAPAPIPPRAPWPPRGEPPPPPLPEQAALSGEELVRFVQDALDRRRAIEERAETVGEKLARHREAVAALKPIEPQSFQASARGNEAYETAVRKRDETLVQMRAEELEILRELDAVRDEFATLSSTVSAANGGELPEDWKPKMQCEACPRS
jgi:hypothetical protein